MRMPAAVLFDMDGTLSDTEPLWHAGESATMREFGYEWTNADQRHCYGLPIAYVSQYMAGRVPDVQQSIIVETLMDTMAELMETRFAWAPGARRVLLETVELELPRALVSASWRRLVNHILHAMEQDLGFAPFEVSIAGDEVHHGKPDPEAYLIAAARLGVRAPECIIIEDSPAGVAAGLATGAHVIGIEHVAAHEASPQLTVVPSLQGVELAQLIAGMGGGVPPHSGHTD